ncbi:ADP-ribose pyrophosphatase YjhB, NUDIX family [Parapedobacter composti]|uniref:ADP-ribose pyrophosphatase YjhB, NUDIX family n=2 Tax=Parapedobacter composti TaxID=623281 RepID=A0A1I1KW34_9SPHI|nr:ADP-ribose pyrophosphatase YjhB, NUDIX family [Parapedobacter composti]
MNQSVLVLADFIPKNLTNFQTIDHQEFDFEKLFKQTKSSGFFVTFFILIEKPKEILHVIKKKVRLIKASGGLVKNGEGSYLFIHRLGKWDLPKGKVDEGESMKKAAVREVSEECGIKVDYLGQKILTTYHAYQMKGELVLKKTNWYEMGVNKIPKLKPQVEEDITEAIWLAKEKFTKIRENTYPLIEDILDTIQQ